MHSMAPQAGAASSELGGGRQGAWGGAWAAEEPIEEVPGNRCAWELGGRHVGVS
jgi:hypothetical protein